MGVKTKSESTKWHPYVIFNMLENVHYIGLVRWNWRKVVKIVEEQEIKSMRPKAKVDEYLIFEGKHDGIVSKEIFEPAKQIRGSRPPYKTILSIQYLIKKCIILNKKKYLFFKDTKILLFSSFFSFLLF